MPVAASSMTTVGMSAAIAVAMSAAMAAAVMAAVARAAAAAKVNVGVKCACERISHSVQERPSMFVATWG